MHEVICLRCCNPSNIFKTNNKNNQFSSSGNNSLIYVYPRTKEVNGFMVPDRFHRKLVLNLAMMGHEKRVARFTTTK